jgi:hypothetical protein
VSTSVCLPDLDVGHLLDDRSKLCHLLTNTVELLGQPSVQLCLFGKAVLGILLVTQELGLLLAASHKGL